MTNTITEEFPEMMNFALAVQFLGVSKYKFRALREAGLINPVGGQTSPLAGHPIYRKSELAALKAG